MSGKKRRPGGRQQRRQNIFKRVQRWLNRQEGLEVSRPSPDLDDGGPELDTPLLDQVEVFGQDNQPATPDVDGPAAEPAQVDGPLTFTREVYQKHQGQTGEMEMDTAGMEGEIVPFQEHWAANQARYEGVAAQTGIPAELVAAIHWREGSGNFGTYLHQGDPLGVAAVNWPTDIPVFHNWEEAAVHALQMKDSIRRDLGLNENSTDVAAMATFAEYYNGLGYHNRGADSAYVYSGTDQYESGKYVADGVYDPNTVDRQVGVLALMDAIDTDFEQTAAVGDIAGSGFGKQLLRQGASGEDVLQMQQLLNEQGADLEEDGVYGPLTAAAVREFQRANGLEVDGICGPITASVLLGNGIPAHDNPAPQEGGGGVTSGGGAVPTSDGLAGERGALAAKSARMELVEGQGEYGSGTWETGGANQGAMVNEYQAANGAATSSDYAWCGMFVGYNFAKAGIRSEIERNLVFWSGYRLHEFFENGTYVGTSQPQAGDWFEGHKSLHLAADGATRKAQLDGFGPQPGDIVLFRSDYSHVAMVSEYDAATGNLMIIEGNRGDKVQATVYGSGDDQITYISRFNDSDYGEPVNAALAQAADPTVSHRNVSGAVSTQ